jgi:hypothetical protein
VNIFLGDEVTLTKNGAWVTGKVNGVKLEKGHLQLLQLEEIPVWFSLELGWKVVNDDEETELDD